MVFGLKKKTEKKKTITQANLEESREEILAKGKKFKYPFQYAKHRVVINTMLIGIAVLVAFVVVGWAELYKVQSTSEVAFRFTKVLHLPVAKVDGAKVRYSDYLMLYRSSIASIEYQQGKFDDSDDSKRQLNHYKRQALSSAEDYAYALAKLNEAGKSVTNEEVDEVIENHRTINGERRSDEAFRGIIRDNFGLSISEYRRLVLLSLAKKKYSAEFDKRAQEVIADVRNKMIENGGDAQAAAGDYTSDGLAVVENTDGMVDVSNLDGGRAAKAAELENNGDISEPFVSRNGDGYYIVKLNSKDGDKVNYTSVWVRFTEFDALMTKNREENKVTEYIEVVEESEDVNVESDVNNEEASDQASEEKQEETEQSESAE